LVIICFQYTKKVGINVVCLQINGFCHKEPRLGGKFSQLAYLSPPFFFVMENKFSLSCRRHKEVPLFSYNARNSLEKQMIRVKGARSWLGNKLHSAAWLKKDGILLFAKGGSALSKPDARLKQNTNTIWINSRALVNAKQTVS
jgi:hypothetical protein